MKMFYKNYENSIIQFWILQFLCDFFVYIPDGCDLYSLHREPCVSDSVNFPRIFIEISQTLSTEHHILIRLWLDCICRNRWYCHSLRVILHEISTNFHQFFSMIESHRRNFDEFLQNFRVEFWPKIVWSRGLFNILQLWSSVCGPLWSPSWASSWRYFS